MIGLLREVGELRQAPRGRARRRRRCRCPSRRSTSTATRWALEFRRMLPVEEWNAQMSLLTGHRRRVADGLRAGRPAAHAAAAGRTRRAAAAPHRARAAASSGRPRRSTPTSSAPSTRTGPRTPRWWWPAPGCCAAPATSPSTARCRTSRSTPRWPSEYAHVTAPLRRLVDRYAGEICLALVRRRAGARVGAGAARTSCPKIAARSRPVAPTSTKPAVLDLVEAAVLRPHVGERVRRRVVVASTRRTPRKGALVVQRAGGARPRSPAPGRCRSARTCGRTLVEADPARRTVRFTL